MATADDVVHVSEQVMKWIKDNHAGNASALTSMELVAVCMRVAQGVSRLGGTEKKHLVIAVLEKIARGQDGIVGTADDVLSPQVVQGVRTLLSSDLVEQTIDLIVKVAKKEITLKRAAMGCLGSLFCRRTT